MCIYINIYTYIHTHIYIINPASPGGWLHQQEVLPPVELPQPGAYTITRTPIYIYIYVYMCMCVYVYIYIYIYMYTYDIHTTNIIISTIYCYIISTIVPYTMCVYMYIYIYIYNITSSRGQSCHC